MQTKRLMILRDFLRTMTPKQRDHFNLDAWAEFSNSNLAQQPLDNLLHCGTTACACGWAASLPEFQKAGLKMVPGFAGGYQTDMEYNGLRSWSAIEAFFGLTVRQAEWLFMDECYRDAQNGWLDGGDIAPEWVAYRIDALINDPERVQFLPKDYGAPTFAK